MGMYFAVPLEVMSAWMINHERGKKERKPQENEEIITQK